MMDYGRPEVLKSIELPMPRPTPDQVLVRVTATSVNPADCKQRSGNLKRVVKHSFPCVLCQDFSGYVVQVGAKCSKFKVGDKIYGSTAPRNGCAAEYVAVYEREAAVVPESLDLAEAATVPTVGCTAYKGMILLGQVRPGQRVLVHGASGGVGAAAVQIACAAGCVVWGTCSARNRDYVQSLGATALDYNTSFETQLDPHSFDLVFDSVGGDEYYRRSQVLLSRGCGRGGQYITAVGPVLHGGSEEVTYGQMLGTAFTLGPRMVGNVFASQKYKLYLGFETEVLDKVSAMISTGQLSIRRDPEEFTLESLEKAHVKCETNHTNGKLLVLVSAAPQSSM